MLKSCKTQANLVTNIWDVITSSDEAYAATATKEAIGPVARSIFIIQKGNEKDGAPDNLVRYGQDIRLASTL